MCGISGLIQFSSIITDNDFQTVKDINSEISHRGPDAEGFFQNEHVVLGHRRLSIIDISENSNQPMFDRDREIALVFNGEIYNHEELRGELEQEFNFNTDHSDTETIIYAYKKWGMDCLKRFTGMFAFALYDIAKSEVILARDRLGKKPLFYSMIDGATLFCSESSALFKANELEKFISDEAIYDYLTYLTTNAPNSFFENVAKIPAGCYLKVTKDGHETTKYWDIAEHINTECNDSDEMVAAKTSELLSKSMQYRNVSDVPIAIALSGGLDSSLNMKFAKELSEREIVAITVSYSKTSEFDESAIAEKYSKELGVKFISVKIDKEEYKKWILEYFDAQKDTPIGDPNSPLLYGISKVAAQHNCKVLLVGEGGDELGGYPVYSQLQKLHKYSSLFPKQLLKFANLFPWPRKLKRELEVVLSGGAESRRFLFGFTDDEKTKFWHRGEQRSSMAKLAEIGAEIKPNISEPFLRKVLNIEYKLRLAELLLPRVDYPSMAASIEARSPFMDHSLIEYSARIPFSTKMKDGPKTVLRKFAAKLLPNYLLSQPKVGFGMLLAPFLKEDLPEWFKSEVLEDPDSPIKSYVKESFLRELYQNHCKGRNDGYRMWVLFSLNKWLSLHK